jgi:hypothetical protein
MVLYEMAGDETMMLLLNPTETEKYLDDRAREKILEETSRFPPDMKLPKPRPMPLTNAQKGRIKQLYAEKMPIPEIAKRIGTGGRQVSGYVSCCLGPGLSAKNLRPKVDGLQPMKPLVLPPNKTRQDVIDEMILAGAAGGKKHVTIASDINREVGGCMMPDDVSKRLAELRA